MLDNQIGSNNRNAGPQLNGVLKDLLTNQENVNFLNSLESQRIHLNSSNSTFCNSLSKKDIKDKIQREIKFYDSNYYKTRKFSQIKLFISGHGNKGEIPLATGATLLYV